MGGGEGELEAVSTPRVKGLGPHLSTIRSMQLCQELQVRPPPPRPPRPAPLASPPPRPPAPPARASARVLLPAATRHGRKCLSWVARGGGAGAEGPAVGPAGGLCGSRWKLAGGRSPLPPHLRLVPSRRPPPRHPPQTRLHGSPFRARPSAHACCRPCFRTLAGARNGERMGGGRGGGAGSPSLWAGSVQRPRGPHAAAPSVGRLGAAGGGHPAVRAPA